MKLAEILPLVLLVLVFWFLILRPMRKRQQQFAKTQGAVEVGTRVMLASGIFGDVVSVGDETVELRISPETTVTVLRQAIARVVAPEQPEGN
ncbi:MAG: preprotein translocase subunit YajC [Kineosporiaceae bacterium]|nr:preprotein translocase subunit YajC [Aeromicrobium sp.]